MSAHGHTLPGISEFKPMFYRLLANFYGVSLDLDALGLDTGLLPILPEQ